MIVEPANPQSELIQPCRLLVGMNGRGSLGCAGGEVDRDPGIGGRPGQDVVVRQLRQRRLRRRQMLEGLGGTEMEIPAHRSRQRRVQHVPDQGMREPPRATRHPRLHQDVGGGAFVEQRQELGGRAILDCGRQLKRDLDADHGRPREHFVAWVAQSSKAPPDDRLDTLGDAERLARAVGWPVETSLLREHADDLADEQRVALGLSRDGLRQPFRRPAPRGDRDVASHLVDGETRRIEPLGR